MNNSRARNLEKFQRLEVVKPILSVFFHNYYGNDSHWFDLFKKEIPVSFDLYYNAVAGSYYRIRESRGSHSKASTKGTTSHNPAYIREASNKGKDIGGKLVLMDAYLRNNASTDYIMLMHDKQSPYHSNSEQWTEDLSKISKKEYIREMLKVFQSDPKVGIVASKKVIRNEYDNDLANNAYISTPLIKSLQDKYNIHPRDLDYVAGTMFCVRSDIYREFFAKHPPLEIRSTLEEGNVLDDEGPTVTHCWERLLAWIVLSKGLKIHGI